MLTSVPLVASAHRPLRGLSRVAAPPQMWGVSPGGPTAGTSCGYDLGTRSEVGRGRHARIGKGMHRPDTPDTHPRYPPRRARDTPTRCSHRYHHPLETSAPPPASRVVEGGGTAGWGEGAAGWYDGVGALGCGFDLGTRSEVSRGRHTGVGRGMHRPDTHLIHPPIHTETRTRYPPDAHIGTPLHTHTRYPPDPMLTSTQHRRICPQPAPRVVEGGGAVG